MNNAVTARAERDGPAKLEKRNKNKKLKRAKLLEMEFSTVLPATSRANRLKRKLRTVTVCAVAAAAAAGAGCALGSGIGDVFHAIK